MTYRERIYYTEEQKALMWDRWQEGDTLHTIAALFDRSHGSIAGILSRTGGIRPPPRCRSRLALTLAVGGHSGYRANRAPQMEAFSSRTGSKTNPSYPPSATSINRSKYWEPRRCPRNCRGLPGMFAPMYQEFVRG